MAYAYTERFVVWEPGDKVIVNEEDMYDEEDLEGLPPLDTIFTVKTVELKTNMRSGDIGYQITLVETDGSYSDLDFKLHSSVAIRET